MSKPSLEKRLSLLPRGSELALTDLLSLEHLSETDMSNILDAAELAGTPQFALGFSVTYLHLIGTGVPMRDVIRMACTHGRRINLRWSRKRWQDEHAYLSRAETLTRLSEEAVQYDLTRYRQCLPERWHGYLIGSSRRLGFEGLRQRHCVASYHYRIISGALAIAAVFHNKRRWTVELRFTAEEQLSLTQAKSRYNRLPDETELAAIHSELGVEPRIAPTDQMMVNRPEETHLRDNWERVLPILADFGVSSVAAEFDGYGDSGNIEAASFADAAGDSLSRDVLSEMEGFVVNQVHTVTDWVRPRTVSLVQERQLGLIQAVEFLIEETVSTGNVDWYNNDGGYGEFYLSVPNAAFNLDISTRWTESDIAHSEEDRLISSL